MPAARITIRREAWLMAMIFGCCRAFRLAVGRFYSPGVLAVV
jgi:hypothetical protein